MEAEKLKTPPFRTELAFGDGPDDVLHLLLDRDIITEEFLTKMDHSARRIFSSTLASVRLVVEQEQRKLTATGTETHKKGARQRKRPTKAQLKSMQEAAVQRSADDILADLSKMLPGESESWLLAQAEECTYMSETLARVILEWDLTANKVMIPITAVRDFACCKEDGSQCRHPSDFLRSRPLELRRKLFQFCLFEAQAPKKKVGKQ